MPPVSRGDLQTTFCFRGFDEVRRLGLTQAMEAQVRLAPVRSHGVASGERRREGGAISTDPGR